ncbi:MAG: hypothetical protein EBX05_10025 [Rhodobacteraceae bacterium]|nr:hypothetical protein [Paracoccaceae bacterium]
MPPDKKTSLKFGMEYVWRRGSTLLLKFDSFAFAYIDGAQSKTNNVINFNFAIGYWLPAKMENCIVVLLM